MINEKCMQNQLRTITAVSQASDKEKYEACIAMLKAYYDAIETRLGQNIIAYIGAIGWLITSKDARTAMTYEWTLAIAISVSLILLIGYILNIRHYVHRWQEIRETVVKLDYMPEVFYARYEIPNYTIITYSAPIVLLNFCLITMMLLCFLDHIPSAG